MKAIVKELGIKLKSLADFMLLYTMGENIMLQGYLKFEKNDMEEGENIIYTLDEIGRRRPTAKGGDRHRLVLGDGIG